MKRKIVTSYILILLVGTLTTGIFSFSFLRNSYFANMEEKLLSYGQLITDSLLMEEESGDLRNFFWLTQKFAQRTRVRVTLLDESGKVLADSADNSIIFINQQMQPEVQLAMRGEIRSIQRTDDTTGVNSMFLALPPVHLQGQQMIIRLSDPIEDYMQENLVFMKYVFMSILLGLIIAMIVGLWNVGKITGPIHVLSEAASQLASAKFSTRIHIRTRDELEELAGTFNHMAERLETMISQIQAKNIQLDAMLSGMTDGVMAVDASGSLLMMNRELQRLLPSKMNLTIGSHYQETLGELPELAHLIDETIVHQQALEEEVQFEQQHQPRVLRIKSSLMRDPGRNQQIIGVFLLVQDMTEIRKLENLRNDFVANVTHELRTPLTLISGFVETLQQDHELDEDEQKTALSIIELETERLKRLINDVLTLSEIENMQAGGETKKFNALLEIREVMEWLNPLAQEKSIAVTLEPHEEAVLIEANPGWFRQMLANLLENAIKYTPESGWVTLKVQVADHVLHVMIQDNGIGVPDEEKELIFQRFYRANRNRSREVGGTGLGLTIVQHIVSEMKGTIKVSTPESGGSLFCVCLPGVVNSQSLNESS
ncbi:sensor histidine kinase [Anoxynatronum buryatiense]|uniref:histidine kinase n=1 Tax=Anoxynatronum buryatiense TaxID=489973 RepID=A0AA45WTR4_9CLOT|nr:ATP-binding protein [Anoxynatronum buryatiense]SMP44030.1 two-component system, OmpR family, phosphate regulon sensor histidine kinase PhoR [Anoxynatronum buryatiense]